MYNCSMFKFLSINSNYGNLTPIEEVFDVPFDIKRIYYITNVPHVYQEVFMLIEDFIRCSYV